MEKPALLFLHYFGGSGRTWTPVAEALSDTFTCLTPNLPGWAAFPAGGVPQGGEGQGKVPFHQQASAGREAPSYPRPPAGEGDAKRGTSDTPGEGLLSPFSVDAMAQFALAQIETLNGGPFALVGHSMGGKVAQAVAAARPPGLAALILVAPSPAVPEPMTDAGRAQLRAAWGSPEEARRLVDAIAFRPLPPQWDTMAYDDTLRASQAAWQAWLDSGSREDISARMGQIAVPTRLFAGEHDSPLTPDYLTSEVAGRVAGADVVTVPGTKHLIPLEAPQELADGIRQFVTPLLP